MNLTTDPWIPTITQDGKQRDCSLLDLFASAHELRDLAVKPHEKIALLRLLICITQAALDGPANLDAWESCRADIQPKAKAYLEKWKHAFELFGDGPRFLQVPGLKTDKSDDDQTWATKLDFMLASGNNSILFDNAGGSMRAVKPARLALTLLTFQCFAPCSLIGSAKWAGVVIPKCTAKHAPCTPSCMLHSYLIGLSVLETIHLNLINKEDWNDLPGDGWGKAIWEHYPAAPNDARAVANATKTYLGRLVPLSRLAVVSSDGKGVSLANGFDYPLAPAFRDPATTMIQRKEVTGVLGADVSKSVWRQLPAITIKSCSSKDILSGPLALRNHSGEDSVTLWIAALVTVGNNKIADVIEAAYDIPAGMFRDAGRKLYENGVELAETWSSRLNYGCQCYWLLRTSAMKSDDTIGQMFAGASSQLKAQARELAGAAQTHFWTAVEQHVPKLLNLAGSPETAGELKSSLWGRALKEAAVAAYEHACPHQTPRQIEAFALGRQQLFLPKPKDEAVTTRQPSKNKKTHEHSK
jgi:CRISPR system Cascade subunit CasA